MSADRPTAADIQFQNIAKSIATAQATREGTKVNTYLIKEITEALKAAYAQGIQETYREIEQTRRDLRDSAILNHY